ncbi:MAG: hypothetical protein KAV82_03110 [Phycisphaerae bacterium]|nr:hypothetical protein [Phycisphaerae bacterium]
MSFLPLRGLGVVVLLLAGGCSRTPVDISDTATRQQLSLLMPTKVNIVRPFTRFNGFDNENRPDGIELLVRPINSLGDPVNIAGQIIVELYEFRQASGDSKGSKYKQWDIALVSERDQRMYWNRTTNMYEFHLQFETASLPPSRKYVLQVTYNTPLSEHMVDEYVLEVPLSTPALAVGGD